MSKHTPEPWEWPPAHADGAHIDGPDGVYVLHAEWFERNMEEAEANAARATACVNACAGINPDAVPGLLAACKALIGFVGSVRPGGPVLAGEAEMVSDALIAIALAEGGHA